MSKVILKDYIVVPESDLCTNQEELKNYIKLTLEEPGCIIFEIIQGESDPFRFNVYEVFSDRESLDMHQSRVNDSYWGKVTINAERHYTILE